ncbi:hypothetical protein LIER_06331 [Lithospermum erythrorhizon]|uniref:DUF4283 domain-containing protein n=1 Tax=Lithospermum erythrorhizon TaxID=34254 RepID=A0AAV3P8M9_LITER
MGFKPEFDQMEKFAKSNWGNFGFESLRNLSAGMFLFQFKYDADHDCMLEAGPWIFARRPLIIKVWTHGAKIEHKDEAMVSVWVRIPNPNLQFWNKEMLSRIGSYIGKPLMADSATSALERMVYARVYVLIDVNWELPEFVPLMDDLGNEFQQKISFEWIPPKCSHGKVFGHSNERFYHGEAPLKNPEEVVKNKKFRVVQ